MNKLVTTLKIFLFLFISQMAGAESFLEIENPNIWDRKWQIKTGIYRVMKSGQIGIVDENDKILVPVLYDQVYDLDEEGYVRVLKDMKIGLFHLEKGLILPVEYDQIWPFEDKRTKVLKDKHFGYINPDGSILIPVEYHHIWSFEDGYAKVMKNGKIGLINIEGHIVLPPVYMEIEILASDRIKVIDEDEIFFVDSSGKYIGTEEKDAKEKQNTDDSKLTAPRISYSASSDDIQSESNHKQTKKVIHKKHYTTSYYNYRFRGNLKGINLGLSGLMKSGFKEGMPEGYEALAPIHSKSLVFSIYPFQKSLTLIGPNAGIVTALGLEFQNYRFNPEKFNEINQLVNEWFPFTNENPDVKKSKLVNLYLNVPLMLELKINDGRARHTALYLSAGIIGSLHLKSHTKIVYYGEDGRSNTRKKHDSFDINTFHYSYLLRAGVKQIGIFATYSPQSVFRKGKGPEVYPYSVGISYNFY